MGKYVISFRDNGSFMFSKDICQYLCDVKSNTSHATIYQEYRATGTNPGLPTVDYQGEFDPSGYILRECSHLLVFQINLPKPDEVKLLDELKKEPFVFAIHKTAEGDAFLVYVLTDWNSTEFNLPDYEQSFRGYMKILHKELSSYMVSTSVKQLLFSYDPDAYVTDKPWTWYSKSYPKYAFKKLYKACKRTALKAWNALCGNVTLPEQLRVYYSAQNCAKYGLPLEEGRDFLSSLTLQDQSINIEEQLMNGYRTVLAHGQFGQGFTVSQP